MEVPGISRVNTVGYAQDSLSSSHTDCSGSEIWAGSHGLSPKPQAAWPIPAQPPAHFHHHFLTSRQMPYHCCSQPMCLSEQGSDYIVTCVTMRLTPWEDGRHHGIGPDNFCAHHCGPQPWEHSVVQTICSDRVTEGHRLSVCQVWGLALPWAGTCSSHFTSFTALGLHL